MDFFWRWLTGRTEKKRKGAKWYAKGVEAMGAGNTLGGREVAIVRSESGRLLGVADFEGVIEGRGVIRRGCGGDGCDWD